MNQKTEKLNLQANIADPDTFYAELIALQANLSDDEALSVYNKLILLLANHIGDMDVLREAFAVAKAK